MIWRIIAGFIATGLVGTLIINYWEKVQNELRGKKIAVLGPRASGKTTLIRFLLKGELPEEYVATAKPEKFSGNTVNLQDLKLIIEDTTDVPGDIQSHGDWERLYKESDLAFYLIDAHKIHAGEQSYKETVLRDMRHIGEWFDSRKENPPQFFLVATHCDLIHEYASLHNTKKSDFTDGFWSTSVMQNLIRADSDHSGS